MSIFCVSLILNFKPLEQLRMVALQPVVFLAILSSCLGVKLAMFPMFGRSHFMFVARLGQELTERGHEVCKLRILTRQLVIDSSNNLSLTLWRLRDGKDFTESMPMFREIW